MCAARAARSFFLFQPMILLLYDVVVAVAFVVSLTPCSVTHVRRDVNATSLPLVRHWAGVEWPSHDKL